MTKKDILKIAGIIVLIFASFYITAKLREDAIVSDIIKGGFVDFENGSERISAIDGGSDIIIIRPGQPGPTPVGG